MFHLMFRQTNLFYNHASFQHPWPFTFCSSLVVFQSPYRLFFCLGESPQLLRLSVWSWQDRQVRFSELKSEHSVCSTGVRCQEAFFFFFGAAGSIGTNMATLNSEAVNKMINPYQECWDGHDEIMKSWKLSETTRSSLWLYLIFTV